MSFLNLLLDHNAREKLGILGQLPFSVLSQDDYVKRCYQDLSNQPTTFHKNRYLHSLESVDRVTFYRLVRRYLKELLPILYTPTVGEAVQKFNRTFLLRKGLYLAWPHRHKLDAILQSYPKNSIDMVVITDGERVLGLGDQGIGGMEISIAKSMLYVLCAQLAPERILPIYLDVGTNNFDVRNDPQYLGWAYERIPKRDYRAFVDQVIHALRNRFSNLYVHWEDLERDNATYLLEHYETECCTFNDDIQGTGVVTLAGVLRAIAITHIPLIQQRVVIYGGGAAGLGVAEQLCQAMQQAGLTLQEARANIWLIGRHGLLIEGDDRVTTLQGPYARPYQERKQYPSDAQNAINLLQVIHTVRPTFLVGCSGQANHFTREIITSMARYVARPIIFPLSNPTTNCEATPEELIQWTQGKALIATGSPFPDVFYQNQSFKIAQCNNALAFPGIGLGIKASGASRVTKNMLWHACLALSQFTSRNNTKPSLLPDMDEIHQVSHAIAIAVVNAAQKEGVAFYNTQDPVLLIKAQLWSVLDE